MTDDKKTLDKFADIITAIDRTRGNGNTRELTRLIGTQPADPRAHKLVVSTCKEAARLAKEHLTNRRHFVSVEEMAREALRDPAQCLYFDNYAVRVLLEEAINALRKVAQ